MALHFAKVVVTRTAIEAWEQCASYHPSSPSGVKERDKELDRSIIGEWEDAEQQDVGRSCTAGVESFIATAPVGFGDVGTLTSSLAPGIVCWER